MFAALLARWPLVLALIPIICAATFGAISLVPPDYEAEATVALVPPVSSENPTGNRYLLLGGLNPARDIVIKSLDSDQTREQVLEGRADATYELVPDFTTSAPVIVVTATGTSKQEAEEVLDGVLASLPEILVSLQDKIGTVPQARIESLVVARDVNAERAGKKQIRAVIALNGAVVVLGVLAIGAIDGLLRRRKHRSTDADRDSDPADPGTLSPTTDTVRDPTDPDAAPPPVDAEAGRADPHERKKNGVTARPSKTVQQADQQVRGSRDPVGPHGS